MGKKKLRRPPAVAVNPDHLCCSRIYKTGTRGRCGQCGTPISSHAQSDAPPTYAPPRRTRDERAVDQFLHRTRSAARQAGINPDEIIQSTRQGFGATGESHLRAGKFLASRVLFFGGEMIPCDDGAQAAEMRFAIYNNLPFASSLTARK